MPEAMTCRERWLAALALKPVDRLPFWPKLNGAYVPYQKAPWNTKTVDELHAFVGSDLHLGVPCCARLTRHKTSIETDQKDGSRRVVYKTPSGDLDADWQWDEDSKSWHPVTFPVKTAADIDLLRVFFEDETHELDPEQLDQAKVREKEIAQSGLVVCGHGVSPLMDWIQHLAGVEEGTYLLFDHTDKVEALFDTMHRGRLRRLEIITENAPSDAIYSVENTSTTLISLDMFRRYPKVHLTEYGRVIGAAGKHHIIHMCGKLKLFLPDIAEVPASAIEAFTSPPVGSTTLLDGRTGCPDYCFIGGTSATLWLEPAEDIIETIRRDLDALPHTRGVVVTSAGVMPPFASPECIKAVRDWVNSYPVRN